MDKDNERQRLAVRYAAMEDGELQKVAINIAGLTEVAQEALRAEMSKRGLEAGSKVSAPEAGEIHVEPVILRKYRDLPEAMIAKSVLESAGIECFLADENMVRLDWFYSNLVGGIKLLVREEDADAAAKLLDDNQPDNFNVDGVGEYDQPRCPHCGSMDVSLDGLDKRWTFGAMWLTGLPIPVTNKGWKCHTCGHAWSGENDTALPPTPAEPTQ